MINKIKKVFFAGASSLLVLPMMVSAQWNNPDKSYGLPDDTDVDTVLTTVLEYILGFLAVLSILMIVIAGIMYVTSGGDESRVDKAKSWLTYAIVGLVVALLGFVIVSTIANMLGAS